MLAGNYGLVPIEKLALGLAPIGALSQWIARAKLFLEHFLKLKLSFHTQPLRERSHHVFFD